MVQNKNNPPPKKMFYLVAAPSLHEVENQFNQIYMTFCCFLSALLPVAFQKAL